MGKIVLAVTSDLHCGSTVAVCPDEPIPLDDGGTYNPSKAQHWLWDCWHTFWGRKPDAIFIVRGTETHAGTSGGREESMGRRLADQGYPVQREPATDNHSWYNLRADINGQYVSFAHHGRIGRLWQLHTAFTHKAVPESLADIGGIIVVFDGDTFDVEPVLFKPARSPLWKAA